MKKRGIFFRILVLSILSVIVLAGCQQNPEEGPRKVAQTYFDAVKMGDLEFPVMLQKYSKSWIWVWT